MKAVVTDGYTLDEHIPLYLRDFFYKSSYPEHTYNTTNGYTPYDFSTNGLVLYLPLWALKGSPFKSVDAYQHTLTVSGASWRPDGYYLDGNDYIYETVADFRSADSAGTMLVWFKTSATGTLVASADEGTAAEHYMVFLVIAGAALRIDQKNGVGLDSILGDVDVADGEWHLGAVTSDGTTYALYTDAAVNGLSVSSGANTGDWFADTDNRDNITVGALKYSSIATYLTGSIGEVWIYSRALSAAEVLHNYNTTAWRYQ